MPWQNLHAHVHLEVPLLAEEQALQHQQSLLADALLSAKQVGSGGLVAMKKDLLTFAFLFQGYSPVKVNLAHLVPFRAKGLVPSLGLVSLRFIPDQLTISGACSEFSQQHGCFWTVTSALHSS